jgi:Sec-independent protein translocase protein TatA
VSLGPTEILVLLVLVLVGPRRLPEAVRRLGPAWRDLRRALGDLAAADATNAVASALQLPSKPSSTATRDHAGSQRRVGAGVAVEGSA